MEKLKSFAPLIAPHTEVLILGSFPGVKSLEAQEYYAHPQNHFWKIIAAMYPGDYSNYTQKTQNLLSANLGLWDVIDECVRPGSMDSDISQSQQQDFLAIKQNLPNLKAIIHNGKTSFGYAPMVSNILEAPAFYAPSTSAANAQWSFEKKLEFWKNLIRDVKKS